MGERVNPQGGPVVLLSDEPTVELILKARTGDGGALEALLQRCIPSLRRWAHGRLPAAARGLIDTEDLVQEAVLKAITHLETFDSRHVGAMQAYLRTSVINRIRDEIRKVMRRSVPGELTDDIPSGGASPLEQAIREESYERYREGLQRLRARDREIVLARIEAQWTAQELADAFGYRSVDAARMATTRALERLQAAMRNSSVQSPPGPQGQFAPRRPDVHDQ
jgi:RNA polymerase sigma-70 factor, ECF subfamily